jgi:hypothetical protein
MKYLIALIVVIAVVVLGIFTWRQRQRRALRNELLEQAEAAGRGIAEYAERTYGPMGSTTGEILSHEGGDGQKNILGALCYRIGKKADARGESSITEIEHRLYAVYFMDGEVMNGGFHQYFHNSAGNNAGVALAGLKDMGATSTAAILESAMAVFSGGKPPIDRKKRWKVMKKMESRSNPIWENCDSEYYNRKEDEEDVYELCFNYAKKNRAEIILP